MIKEIMIGATYSEEGDFLIHSTPKSKTLSESLELIGAYEFIKREMGEKIATEILLRINYSEKGLFINKKIIEKADYFLIKDVCDVLIEKEMKKICKRLEVKREFGK